MKTSFGDYYRTKQRPIKPQSSDDDSEDSEDDSETSEDSGNDQDSHHPTPSVARGLSNGKLKLFLIDIEESGGLDFCNFKDIFNAKPDLYGNPDSAQRTQFKNKLRTLKRYSPEAYQLVLNERGVKSSRLASPSPSPKPQQVLRSSERTKKPSKSRTTTEKMPSTPSSSRAIALPGSYRSPPLPPSRGRREDNDDPEDIMEEHLADADAFTPVIDIDLVHPENNREVIVYTLNDFEHADFVYKCFNILLPIDPRDGLNDHYTAALVNEREVLITLPALPWSLFKDTAIRNEVLKKTKTHCPKLQMAQDITINALTSGENGSRQTKQLLLRFPANVFLSNIFNEGSRKLETHFQVESVHVEDLEANIMPCFVIWKIVDEGASRRHKLAAATEASVIKMTAQLKRM